jgi:hypothetical protein
LWAVGFVRGFSQIEAEREILAVLNKPKTTAKAPSIRMAANELKLETRRPTAPATTLKRNLAVRHEVNLV